jgi:hypothetical protein
MAYYRDSTSIASAYPEAVMQQEAAQAAAQKKYAVESALNKRVPGQLSQLRGGLAETAKRFAMANGRLGTLADRVFGYGEKPDEDCENGAPVKGESEMEQLNAVLQHLASLAGEIEASVARFEGLA